MLNLTDGDSVIMKGKKGDFNTNYNVQAACSEDQIITFTDVVTAGNDKAQLKPALEGITQNTGKLVKQALADADYGTFDSLEYMDQNDIEGYVPYRNMDKTFEDKPYWSANFDYNKEQDIYKCPADKDLAFYRMGKDTHNNLTTRNYRTDACLTCPFQKQCCQKGTIRRVIKREVRQGLKEEMKERLHSPAGKVMYQKRLHPIESLFGHLKFNLGYQQFLLRGLEKVKAEFTLMCLTYNLRKLIAKLVLFFPYWESLRRILAIKFEKICFPRIVNELLLITLKI